MSKFKVGDKVRTKWAWPYLNLEKNATGEVIEVFNDHYIEAVQIRFDKSGKEIRFSTSFIDKADEGVAVVYRVRGTTGFTDTLSKDQVRSLVALGILFHSHTAVWNSEVVKVYKNHETKYLVSDYRSSRKTLEQEFPQDNQWNTGY